jgi:hypothetical protein
MNNTLLIPIAFPFNEGIRIVSVDSPISQMRLPSAMRAPRETPRRSMKDTCLKPIVQRNRARSGARLRYRFWRETRNRNRACRDRLEPFLLRRDHRLPRIRGMVRGNLNRSWALSLPLLDVNIFLELVLFNGRLGTGSFSFTTLNIFHQKKFYTKVSKV